MGRPLGATNAKFAAIPRTFSGCVYAVELSNGLIKVGHSANPRTRMSCLSKLARREFGASIARFHVGANQPLQSARRAEAAMLKQIALDTPPIAGYFEFFAGVDFEHAAALVDQLSHPA